ncbi:hypothetical protein OIDMADRAFT_34859 [Oidiodendron maius Zn]|uniref:Uncharacterized protein n=1 Tax=Oidiodendron maius (strain Zn) TaxID=913774 RepID=A0A0C3GSM5_OIDMZ|nr:hypothetical protein OIDMADRAFT_34859 [Oidiodendron maius Zn]
MEAFEPTKELSKPKLWIDLKSMADDDLEAQFSHGWSQKEVELDINRGLASTVASAGLFGRNNFQRREITFMEKADELRSEFGRDMYVLGRSNGKLFNYTSRDGPSWRLSLTEVDQSYPRPERYTPASFLKRGTKSLLCEGQKGRENSMMRIEDFQTGDITGTGG